MPPRPAYYLTPARRKPVAAPLAVCATLAAAALMLLLPGADETASVWAPLVALFPESAPSCFALACASVVGCVVGLSADAVGQRRALRPALTAALAAALLAPATLAVPLWPALLAAAALIATPAPTRPRAANDNPIPAHRAPHPFSLAA